MIEFKDVCRDAKGRREMAGSEAVEVDGGER